MGDIDLNEMLATIDTDGSVIRKSISGHPERWVSQDIKRVCERIQAEDELHKALRQSKGLAFFIERHVSGVRVLKTFKTAACFYKLLLCDWSGIPENHELGCRSQLFRMILEKFNARNICFTENPLVIFADGVLEADIVNGITKQMYELLSKKSNIANARELKAKLRNIYTKAERLVHRLLDHHACLSSLSLNLCYRTDYPDKSLFANAEECLQRFLAHFDPLPESAELVGFWWKHEYLPERGYRHLLGCWFRGAYTGRDGWITDIKMAWSDATDGYGYVERNDFNPQSPRSWGDQSIITQESHQLAGSLRSIRLLVMRDQYCHLSLLGTSPVFGFSPLPDPAPKAYRPNARKPSLMWPLI